MGTSVSDTIPCFIYAIAPVTDKCPDPMCMLHWNIYLLSCLQLFMSQHFISRTSVMLLQHLLQVEFSDRLEIAARESLHSYHWKLMVLNINMYCQGKPPWLFVVQLIKLDLRMMGYQGQIKCHGRSQTMDWARFPSPCLLEVNTYSQWLQGHLELEMQSPREYPNVKTCIWQI